jgi:aspartate kinase
MRVLVQKYGGSSVATTEKLQRIAQKVVATKQSGVAVVVVVSAMGQTTSDLLALATDLTSAPDHRELDMLLSTGECIAMSLLSMAIQARGVDAISLTGSQAGIRTDDAHTYARITQVQPWRIQEELARDRIVIVAGFQGLNSQGDITTLGRGGSDTSAVALAAALGAERCDIYSDVDGVYTADPRIVPAAQPIDVLSYDEMQELARLGAQVLNAEAVALARQHDVEIAALSAFDDNGGTRIRCPEELNRTPNTLLPVSAVTGVAGRRDLIRVCFDGPRAVLPQEEAVLEALTACHVLSLRRYEPWPGRHCLDVLVAGENIAEAKGFATRLRQAFADAVTIATDLGSVAAVGLGIGDQPTLRQQIHQVLLQEGIAPVTSLVAPASVTWVVPAAQVDTGLRTLHQRLVEMQSLEAVGV